MMKPTHLAIAGVAAIPLFKYGFVEPIAFGGLMGAVAPDWDIYLSFFGMEHRTWTHSILALVLSTILFMYINKSLGILWGVSYTTHLLADSFTKMGVPYLYPFKHKYFGPKKIRSCGAEDMLLFLIFFYLLIELIR
ncbi:metal-dependent hydrolase [Clostridium perfringens]|uniref:Metal-dependent hydrolase n=2 Tax=Clostridium perfringens TaxID=1502 RepID=A0AAE8FQ19_CLOPF|nr:metal-dependent hydrolase [Clostridium perfringens]ELC8390953.1 metal-dependent hydrolase [Clostridium perfringens]MBI5998705.1 metal-dependent hydrolase [Clostridium perfringens]MBI6047141.1 metal-dependent hydrolase [Clostridium perfringens]MDJ8959780.1 metal-dependent hydrolase [Clostridium perfringens]MDK0761116.1 metal-dependent hydrolase [Clostridium perfringens]